MKRGIRGHHIRSLVVALGIGLLGASGAPAEARQSPGPIVDIQSAATLTPDGQSITVQLLASCPERWTVVEAVVAVSQPQASGQASFPLTCIGSLRPFSVTVPSGGGTFQLGNAQASASVLIERGRTERAQDAGIVDVQPGVFVELADTARLESGGGAVLIDVTSACPVGANGQQSFVGVSQSPAYGNGTYFTVCDGRHHTVTVRVQASQGAYRVGSAQAQTFANVEHGGNGFSGFDESAVQIVG
jgi:hypothetical protein